jgi:MoxR-like ATPase
MSLALPNSVDAVIELLAAQNYVCDRPLATALFLSLKLQRPLLLEGAPGVGKTELAKSLARALNTLLLRVQCYEGLDVAQTAYEWNVARQMIEIRLAEAVHDTDRERLTHSLYSRPMLIERPLLQALTQPRSPVLLIDELDRADEPFDAFLLEVLAENQLTIPEYGTVVAAAPPITLITSNRTREIHDALKRRCLYHWVGFPSVERELDIVRPGAGRPSGCTVRWSSSSSACAPSTCSSRPASPSRSTGPTRWSPSTPSASIPRTCRTRSACCSSTRTIC